MAIDSASRPLNREYAIIHNIAISKTKKMPKKNPKKTSQPPSLFDNLDLFQPAASDGDIAYTYDAAGNRMTRTEDGATVTYTLGVGDRLASWTGGAYTHDAAGNVARIEREGRPTLFLTWNSRYQLDTVYTNGVFAEGYAYDALGRRVATANMEGTTYHVYDDNWQVVADVDTNGNVIASYVWGDGIDNLLAVNVGGASYYPLTDIQGTVWGYVDSQNNVVARWQYDAWGNVVDESVSVPALATLRYRFQCREWSAATGLVHFRMRWYDPETGRWLSKDPIGLSGGLNLYAFCGDDPVSFNDLYGLEKKSENDKIVISPSGKRIPYPPDVDIKANINAAKKSFNPFWFRNQVRNKGPWDYKQRGKQYESFGNFHYGVVGRAFGFSKNTLLREAGRAQQAAGTSKPEWGDPGFRFNPWGGSGSYGDDPNDQELIEEGVRYYDSGAYMR